MMSNTLTKLGALGRDLRDLAGAMDEVEREQRALRDRLVGELDGVLALLSQMLVQHAARPDLVRDIRERLDSTLDERNRLSGLGRFCEGGGR
jgi:hypothetical protein